MTLQTKHLPAYLAILAALFLPALSQAHFQMLIPSSATVTPESANPIELALTFTHPMEGGPVMSMVDPVQQFGVVRPKGREDLAAALEASEIEGKRAFAARYRIERPGDYRFYVVPGAYWEPAEGVMIVHYTKVIVNAFGLERGWDEPVGLPVEIVPLVRPYGLWAGNLFTGIVTRDGQPVPFAEIEVEWVNDGSVTPPADPFITQVLKADANGVFSYAMPRPGWWGFAALLEGENKMPNPDGESVPVEMGALIWVNTHPLD